MTAMNLKKQAQAMVAKTSATLGVPLSEEQSKALQKIIEQTLIDTVNAATTHSSEAARQCCSADRDLAHKIAEQIELANKALVANLSGMR